MSEHHTEYNTTPDNSSAGPPRKRKQKGPTDNPDNLSEQLVAETVRGRESKCSHGCGSDGNGCATGGCGVGSIVEMIANNFTYSDERSIVEISYPGYRKGFAVLADAEVPLRVRDTVIVRGENGTDWATVSMTGSLVHAKRKAKRLSNEELPTLLRPADENDLKRIEQCKISERQAFSVCKTRIEAFELPMTLVGSEWQFDHKKLTFFFTADGRVDFRELVRDLAAIFNTRIELRQIPVRDAAKRLGGMGVCGLELCCTTHLGRYEHVTLDHAKIQQIPANPSKLSGQCGRLKCCLLYEVDTYVEGLKRFPPIESTVKTANGTGVIHKIDLFRDLIYLHFPETSSWETVSLEDYRDLAAGRKTKKQREEEEERERTRAELERQRSVPVGKDGDGRGSEKKGGGRSKSRRSGSGTKGKQQNSGQQGGEGNRNTQANAQNGPQSQGEQNTVKKKRRRGNRKPGGNPNSDASGSGGNAGGEGKSAGSDAGNG